jgi:hypothetical protein
MTNSAVQNRTVKYLNDVVMLLTSDTHIFSVSFQTKIVQQPTRKCLNKRRVAPRFYTVIIRGCYNANRIALAPMMGDADTPLRIGSAFVIDIHRPGPDVDSSQRDQWTSSVSNSKLYLWEPIRFAPAMPAS